MPLQHTRAFETEVSHGALESAYLICSPFALSVFTTVNGHFYAAFALGGRVTSGGSRRPLVGTAGFYEAPATARGVNG